VNALHCLQHSIPRYSSSFTVILYNCGDLSGDDCSGCLGLSADYRCGYCRPNCILNSLGCGSSVIQAPNFQQCGATDVTEVSGMYTAQCCDLLTTCLSLDLVWHNSLSIIINLSLPIDLPLCWSCCWKHSLHSQGH